MSDRRERSDWTRLARLAEAGVLSASMMHEVRQPLFAIKALAQIARHGSGQLGGEQLSQLLVHVRQIEEMLEQYAGFGNSDEPALHYDFNEPVRLASDMLAHRAKQERISVSVSLCPRSLLVLGRSGAMRQVVVNLLQNALDAVEGRDERRVSIRTTVRAEQAVLTVGDSGQGIPAEMRARLFEPFATSKGPKRGTGLGLYIARQLVTEAGGTLQLNSTPEQGTTVEVVVPRAIV